MLAAARCPLTPPSPAACPVAPVEQAQVQKWHYEIPGFPWNDGVSPAHPRYPTGPEVQAYLQRYAADAGLLPLIRFHVDVKVLRPVAAAGKGAAAGAGAPGWEVEWTDRAG